jgi:hypothetical protein
MAAAGASPYPLAYDLLPLTFAAVALVVGAWRNRYTGAPFAVGAARTGADRPGLRRLSLNEVARLAPGPI